jgi:hypothetical protein
MTGIPLELFESIVGQIRQSEREGVIVPSDTLGYTLRLLYERAPMPAFKWTYPHMSMTPFMHSVAPLARNSFWISFSEHDNYSPRKVTETP